MCGPWPHDVCRWHIAVPAEHWINVRQSGKRLAQKHSLGEGGGTIAMPLAAMVGELSILFVPYSNKAREAMLEDNNIANEDEIDDSFQIEDADDFGDEIDLGELFGDFADESDDDNM